MHFLKATNTQPPHLLVTITDALYIFVRTEYERDGLGVLPSISRLLIVSGHSPTFSSALARRASRPSDEVETLDIEGLSLVMFALASMS